jgi:hypothetical protein
MDHAYIDENQVAELYLLGKLPPEEAARFEEHSMSCQECLDRLETAETLRLGLRTVAAHEIAAEAVKIGLLARLMRSRLAPLALTALLLIAVVPAGLLWRRAGRLEGELAQTREQVREALSRPAPTPAPDPDPDPEIGALRSQLDEQRLQAAAERQERERLSKELEKAGAPRINVPVVPLSPERSAPGASPSTRISLSSSSELLVLSLELDATDFRSYSAHLAGSGTRTVWHVSGLRPDTQGSLTLALPATQLQPGDVTVRVEGLPAQGRPVPVADFSFRIVR